MITWPILSVVTFLPLVGALIIYISRGDDDAARRNSRWIALWTTVVTFGISLIRMGNFDVNLSEEDETQLKGLAKDTAYSRLAGSFQQYASGEMMKGAGEGMSKGGGAVGGAFIGVGMGILGWIAAAVHLLIFDRLYLRRGRLERIEKLQDKPKLKSKGATA